MFFASEEMACYTLELSSFSTWSMILASTKLGESTIFCDYQTPKHTAREFSKVRTIDSAIIGMFISVCIRLKDCFCIVRLVFPTDPFTSDHNFRSTKFWRVKFIFGRQEKGEEWFLKEKITHWLSRLFFDGHFELVLHNADRIKSSSREFPITHSGESRNYSRGGWTKNMEVCTMEFGQYAWKLHDREVLYGLFLLPIEINMLC